MSYSKSPLAFDDIREVFDQALAAPKGLRIPFPSRGIAISQRSRFNYFRKIDRQINMTLYPKDHSMHGHSAYDKLILSIPAKGTPEESVLYIQPRLISNMQIEVIQ
jgi:hypothetical protein